MLPVSDQSGRLHSTSSSVQAYLFIVRVINV